MAGDMTNSISPKRPRIRMAPEQYATLRREILDRDGWRCQKCGCSKNLDVHHIRRRSALGDDAETNLITLCRECHKILHDLARAAVLPISAPV
jgi:5-methylcytosine-specific restriction endonuclease McrA